MARRNVLRVRNLALVVPVIVAACAGPPRPAPSDALVAVESRIGGRLGVAAVTASGRPILQHRADERFAMCSTFKAPLAAFVLERVAAGALRLDERITFSEDDLVPYAPVVEQNLDAGRLAVEDLCRAAVQLSDNVAANLLLKRLGGPPALTGFFGRHGAARTRLDRYEIELNENAIGDPRDTTTPREMAVLLARLLYADDADTTFEQLRTWMIGARTGRTRIRAGVPAGSVVGNKTGTAPAAAPAFCDVAFIERPAAEPIVLAVYCDRPTVDAAAVDAAIADVARLAIERAGAAP